MLQKSNSPIKKLAISFSVSSSRVCNPAAASDGRLQTCREQCGKHRKTFAQVFIISFFIAAVLSLALAPDVSLADIPDVTAAVPRHFPPYYTVSKNGVPEGFAIDVTERIAGISRLKITYLVKNSWTEVTQAVKSGQADLIPNIGISAARDEWLDFTAPVETFAIKIFVRRDGPDIRSADELAKYKTGAVKTNIAFPLLKERTNINLEVYDDIREALFELIAGHIDAHSDHTFSF